MKEHDNIMLFNKQDLIAEYPRTDVYAHMHKSIGMSVYAYTVYTCTCVHLLVTVYV